AAYRNPARSRGQYERRGGERTPGFQTHRQRTGCGGQAKLGLEQWDGTWPSCDCKSFRKADVRRGPQGMGARAMSRTISSATYYDRKISQLGTGVITDALLSSSQEQLRK